MCSTPFNGFLDLIERMHVIRFADQNLVGMVREGIASGFPLEGSQTLFEEKTLHVAPPVARATNEQAQTVLLIRPPSDVGETQPASPHSPPLVSS
jgi:hypothetical protein